MHAALARYFETCDDPDAAVRATLPRASRLTMAVCNGGDPQDARGLINRLPRSELEDLAIVLAGMVPAHNRLQTLNPHGVTDASRILAEAIAATAQQCRVNRSEITSRGHHKDAAWARDIVCWTAASLGLSYTQIARQLHISEPTLVEAAVTHVTRTPPLLAIAYRVRHALRSSLATQAA